ncbi:hypothetical protein RRG08_044630 [Elysia crispata]|uniref:Uncharacterized protein n=1 Tax=Elysia crispata TaxID=231223 RepID=A0AAE1D1Z1_9GAST|nr:hypothetical protein RRG08_044630 [Elysia crispata]
MLAQKVLMFLAESSHVFHSRCEHRTHDRRESGDLETTQRDLKQAQISEKLGVRQKSASQDSKTTFIARGVNTALSPLIFLTV